MKFKNLGRQSLKANILLPVVGVCLIGFSSMIGGISYFANASAIKQANDSVDREVAIIASTLDFAVLSNNMRAKTEVEAFRLSLPGKPILTGRRVMTGDRELPELMLGTTQANGNLAWLKANKEAFPGRDPAVLIRDGDRMYRGVSLLKQETDPTKYRIGDLVHAPYADVVMQGKEHAETIEREGKMYSLGAKPIFDDSGKNVIGVLTSRVSAEDSMKNLKESLSKLVVGKTGYVYIVQLPNGDSKDLKIVMHPTLAGKTVSDLKDERAKKVFEQILEKRNGTLTYDWPDAEKNMRQKLVVFKEIPDLHWVVVAGSYVDEFTEASVFLRNFTIAALTLFGFSLITAIYFVVNRIQKPIVAIRENIGRVGKGDLTIQVDSIPGSKNEIDAINGSLAEAKGNMTNLATSIKATARSLQNATDMSARSSEQVRQAAIEQAEQSSAISASTEELSVSIDNTTAQAGIVLNLANETVSVVEDGKRVVENAISQMNSIGFQVGSAAVEIKALEAKSSEITATVSTIKEIAEQTNLLALNAAIEAARAGEMGRGFAVVADEVRKLAEQSSKAATAIGKTITSVVDGVSKVHDAIEFAVTGADAGAMASTQAEAALEQIHGVAKRISEAASEVNLMTREQSTAAQSIATSIERMAQSTEETTAAANSSSKTAQELAEMAVQLDREVSVFKL